ncbi:hypothetical protein ACFQ3P_24230 [Paraburkholderia sabiae]|uniref:Uncharacterized protein n=2 Tax=Paraburkholderia sabiae TaxID=273251 RepID=A0ABU9QID0_9BURK|nr:hypothetical protein [Paraburkholderia sabiae]WJZ76374.1 hypothetical protein QEN71_11395 [Paraburkholderia sabiae]CAD6550384.1 hypothetical protein LMG24235_04802 [Paraburkholderia sabiae]
MSKPADKIRSNVSIGAYQQAYLLGVNALETAKSDRSDIVAALRDLTARLRSECMERAIQKMDFGPEYEALERLLRNSNELTGQDMYGFPK